MSKFKEEWKKARAFIKYSTVISVVSALVIIIMVILQLFNVISNNTTSPIITFFLSISLIVNGINLYKYKKKVAIFSFAAAGLTFFSCIISLLY